MMVDGKVFGSKKATMTAIGLLLEAIIALVVVLLNTYTELTPEVTVAINAVLANVALVILGLIGTYNVGQGFADFGKEANGQ